MKHSKQFILCHQYWNFVSQITSISPKLKKQAYLIEQFFRIKGKLEICNNLVAEFDTKFINIAELLKKSYKNLWVELDFVKNSTLLINLVSNSAAELLPFSGFPLNSEELLYLIDF